MKHHPENSGAEMVWGKEHDTEESRIPLQLYCKLNIAFKYNSADFKLIDVAYHLK